MSLTPQDSEAITILRDGLAVGAARFVVENHLDEFTGWLHSLDVPGVPCDELVRRLLLLFVSETGSETVGAALIRAAFMQQPGDPS